MLKLNTASLRAFEKRASVIERNTLLPILSNLKFQVDGDVCLATKSSMNAICCGQVLHEGEETLLIDERILFSLLAMTNSEWITVTKEGTQYTLSDGKDIIPLPSEPAENFPPNPPYDEEAETFTLDEKVIKAINIARSFTVDSETSGSKQFVHMNGELVFAFHDQYFYINNGFTNLPLSMFTKEETAIIVQHTSLNMAMTDRHHIFFADDGYTFIFTQPEGSTLNAAAFLERMATEGKKFSMAKVELINFCNLANTVSESPVATCSLEQDGLFAKLQMNDKSYGRGNHRLVVMEGECGEFNFNSRLILSALKAIPYETINGKTLQNVLIIQNENDLFCFIGMQKI